MGRGSTDYRQIIHTRSTDAEIETSEWSGTVNTGGITWVNPIKGPLRIEVCEFASVDPDAWIQILAQNSTGSFNNIIKAVNKDGTGVSNLTFNTLKAGACQGLFDLSLYDSTNNNYIISLKRPLTCQWGFNLFFSNTAVGITTKKTTVFLAWSVL